jgi:hypothetical protein
MKDEFHDTMIGLISETRRHARAWLGALQHLAYSQPAISRVKNYTAVEGETVRAHIQQSPEVWYEQVRDKVESAFKSADGALSNEWSKRRDPRHGSPDALDEFAHSFESNIATIARAVLDAEQDLEQGVMRQNRHARDSLLQVKGGLRRMIGAYVDHFHEMTLNESGSGLLDLRARIMDGESRAI